MYGDQYTKNDVHGIIRPGKNEMMCVGVATYDMTGVWLRA